MISTSTPYKLAEIVRDTWPGLYRPAKIQYSDTKNKNNDKEDKKIS
jgi:hypothetical protein